MSLLPALAALLIGLGLGVGGALLFDSDGDGNEPGTPTATIARTPLATSTPSATATPQTIVLAPVIVRQGPARLREGDQALVIVGDEVLQPLVREGLEGADLPFELSNVTSELEREGVRVRGTIGLTILGATLSGDFSALVRPYAEDGDIRVEVTDVDAEGLDLPGAFNGEISDVVNGRLGEVVSLEGYQVQEVEVGDGELLVYLRQLP
jgi:hypothetical protein